MSAARSTRASGLKLDAADLAERLAHALLRTTRSLGPAPSTRLGGSRSAYADLRTALGATNYAAALDHYRSYGLREGRRASATFDPRVYLARYADRRGAYGTDHRAALIHWVRYGKAERRNAAP